MTTALFNRELILSFSAVHNYCARGTPAQPASTFGSGPMNQRSTFLHHF